jgi:NCS1 family nucleobase:cation symporter-1
MRGSWIASGMNVMQLIGWAGLEIIIMAQAARAISDEFFGFDGYYLWLALFAVLATAFAVGGPVVVVRQFLERFGFWIVLAAAAWLTYRLFDVYNLHDIWDADGTGGPFPNFWQGVDLAAALPVSWLPLVADYSRYARRAGGAAWATFVSYAFANTWFFALGAGYALVLTYDASNANNLISALVDSMLPLALGWLFLVAILADETDNAFANVYSTAVSLQNFVAVPQRVLAIGVGAAAFLLAVSVDVLGYETFLLLIGGIFVSLFGVMIADYYVAHGRSYDTDALFERGGPYWYRAGFNPAGLLAWFAGFSVYIVTAQPLWVWEHFEVFRDLPAEWARFGGTVPSFAVSFVLYLVLARVLAVGGRRSEAGAQSPID